MDVKTVLRFLEFRSANENLFHKQLSTIYTMLHCLISWWLVSDVKAFDLNGRIFTPVVLAGRNFCKIDLLKFYWKSSPILHKFRLKIGDRTREIRPKVKWCESC